MKNLKVPKGSYGYIQSQKVKRTLITLITLSIPIAAFLIGWAVNGSKESIVTVIAIVGCIPGCKFAVSMIMMFLQKPMKADVYEKIKEHKRDLTGGYEMVISAYEKQTFLDSLVVVGDHVAAYSSRENTDASFAAKHIQTILRDNGFYVHVKVFTDMKHYLERLDQLYEKRDEMESNIKWTPREAYPELSRDEYILHTIYAICL